ncbi:hypothetical protein CONPUDRAFT_154696 [Coniophora puteana RWD-64-598 SS2]|uniref:Uncharacterized protein n=1 Tax=Coniophora puteana (strain RWD-64-598) TaxID=741705 RepID=A0A5M3MNK0_CONPW|nr:uncharacterized protein CONPUDRAFT_154696 [Coniophora puteana RWD-64-598 SS2]EIW80683.1 hypothetical protein CONPUDRAFT_154696 [Coniophora puteana RWD-64-598 SS2]
MSAGPSMSAQLAIRATEHLHRRPLHTLLDHLVSSRAARATYGVEVVVTYDPSKPDHRERQDRSYVDFTGATCLSGAFTAILLKGTRVSETQEFKRTYRLTTAILQRLKSSEVAITVYRGDKENPQWINEDKLAFSPLCTVHADTSAVEPKVYEGGSLTDGQPRRHYSIAYDVVLLFGLTELQAQLRWKENGVTKLGPATIIYEDD